MRLLLQLALIALTTVKSFESFLQPQSAMIRSPIKRSNFRLMMLESTFRISTRTLPLSAVSEAGDISADTIKPVQKSQVSLKDLKEKLAKSGRAGILAYGILNFMYYSIITAITWHFTISRLSISDFSQCISLTEKFQFLITKLGSVMGIVWAGSQVTKVFRISGAIFLAPLCDILMAKCQSSFNLKSRNQAFWIIFASLWITLLAIYFCLVLYASTILSNINLVIL